VKYRRLGSSGLKVSEISLGSWLTYGTAIEQQTANDCIQRAFELGINFFDTSNAYNAGEGEKALGAALKPYKRSDYVLSTKVFFPMGPGANDRGLSRKHIREQCDASLIRLGVEYVDIYFCHRYDETTPLEETLVALNDLVSAGKILYAAVSEWTADQISEAVKIGRELGLRPLVANQPIYNLFERYIEKEVLPVCMSAGIGQVVFSPLAGGVLTGKYKPGHELPAGSRAADDSVNFIVKSYIRDDVLETVQNFAKLASELGISVAQLALAWTLHQPGISTALIGASRASQLDENVKAVDIELSPETLEAMERILEPVRDFSPAR
jgi:voltage-dependent potassium channel beta subunit